MVLFVGRSSLTCKVRGGVASTPSGLSSLGAAPGVLVGVHDDAMDRGISCKTMQFSSSEVQASSVQIPDPVFNILSVARRAHDFERVFF